MLARLPARWALAPQILGALWPAWRFASPHADRDLTVPIPMHPGDVPAGTLRSIIRQMRITVEDFSAL